MPSFPPIPCKRLRRHTLKHGKPLRAVFNRGGEITEEDVLWPVHLHQEVQVLPLTVFRQVPALFEEVVEMCCSHDFGLVEQAYSLPLQLEMETILHHAGQQQVACSASRPATCPSDQPFVSLAHPFVHNLCELVLEPPSFNLTENFVDNALALLRPKCG